LLAILPSDLNKLQSVGREAYEARKELVLRDDQEAVWNYVKTLKNETVDIVLDNGRLHPFE
jgi:damage-control phosphatase, subfamily III